MITNTCTTEITTAISAKDKPKFGTKEWADYNFNGVSLCTHDMDSSVEGR